MTKQNYMLPSGYYTNLDDYLTKRPKVVTAGIPGSGSTLVWQITNALLGGIGVVKTHNYIDMDNDVPVLLSFRYLPAAVVSNFRMMNKCERGPTLDEAKECCKAILQCRHGLLQYCLGHPTAVLQYENFWNNPRRIVDALVWLRVVDGDALTRETIDKTMRRFSLKANRLASESVVGEYDPVTLLHPCHIHEAEPTSWRRTVSPQAEQYLEDAAHEYWNHN